MAERGMGKSGHAPGQVADQGARLLALAPWLAAWGAVLALALWLSNLAWPWLAIAFAGTLAWTVAVARRRTGVGLAAAALLWGAAGFGTAVQLRLDEIVTDWPDLQLRIEESAAEALGQALDALVEQGEEAVSGAAEAAELYAAPAAGARLFARLEELQRRTGVSAVALFDGQGTTLAWAGEHRGTVPAAARDGTENYLFEEGPLFSYLYFIRPLPNGLTATAAFLLDANLEAGEGIVPFATRFQEGYGTRPRFWIPERAQAAAVWDWSTDRPILSVSFAALTQQNWWERVVQNGRRTVGAFALLALLALSARWYRSRAGGSGVPVLVGTTALLIAPLRRMVGMEVLFSPLQFALPGPFDLTLGVLLVLLIGGALWTLTRTQGEPRPRLPWWLTAAAVAILVPACLLMLDRSASTGLLVGRAAGGFPLQIAAALLMGLPLFLALRHTRPPAARVFVGRAGRAAGYALPPLIAVALALWWRPHLPVPVAVGALWALPFVLLLGARDDSSPTRGSLWQWLVAGWLAGSVALAFLWPVHVQAKLERAEREVAMLGTRPDPFLDFLLRQFAEQTAGLALDGETGVNLLYSGWVGSGLAREGYEARMTLWREGRAEAELNLSELESVPAVAAITVGAPPTRAEVRHYGGAEGLHYLLIAPIEDGRTLSVAVPPRRRLGGATPLARFLYPEHARTPAGRAETLYLVPVDTSAAVVIGTETMPRPDTVHWVRTDLGWRSEMLVEMPEGMVHAHLVVATPAFPLVLTRGVLLQTAILLVFLGLWLLARAVCREMAVLPIVRGGWYRSFRGRLWLALFGFFLLPTLAFGAVSYGAVAREVVRSAAALAQQALDQAAARLPEAPLGDLAGALPTDLLVYREGTLVSATAPEVLELGLFHTWLPPAVFLRFAAGEDLQDLEERRIAQSDYLVAYRRLDTGSVLAAPIPLASHEITRRQQEFRDIALLMILVGLGLSIVLALLVSRALVRPLDELRRAAVTVGAGNLRMRLPETRSDEFGSVYASFNRMVGRLRQTRAALVQETRRTETIVAEAATGVLALDAYGRVELVNPRAVEILGVEIAAGEPLIRPGTPKGSLSSAIDGLWRSRQAEAGAELEVEGRVVRLKLRRLLGDGGGGAVVALEDVTAEVRTARVLAWGEVARQVAHEIKNPLTPIKLAVQHLRRAYLDRRPDYEQILDRNVEAILGEIDRLGEIARAFSRFGSPAATASPLERVDVGRAIAETLALYRGAAGGTTFRAELPDEPLPPAVARSAELKEVLLNLLENAREAIDGGGEVIVGAELAADPDRLRVTVADTGIGIPPEELPRIFEPHFSTRSSGTGLGLAIVRRIVDSWGGEIEADSRVGKGTRFSILLRRADNLDLAGADDRVGAGV